MLRAYLVTVFMKLLIPNRVLRPIETSGYGKGDMDKLVEATRERMVEELRAISSSSSSEKKLN